MRAIVSHGEFHAASLVAGLALALVQIALAGWLFNRVYRYAVRSGLLARYSAESLS